MFEEEAFSFYRLKYCISSSLLYWAEIIPNADISIVTSLMSVCIGQFLGANLVVGGLFSLYPLFCLGQAFPCLLPIDFGFAFPAF